MGFFYCWRNLVLLLAQFRPFCWRILACWRMLAAVGVCWRKMASFSLTLFFIKIQKDVFLNFVQLDSKMNLCKLIFLFPYFFHVPDWLSIPKMSWRCLNKLSLHTNITLQKCTENTKTSHKSSLELIFCKSTCSFGTHKSSFY